MATENGYNLAAGGGNAAYESLKRLEQRMNALTAATKRSEEALARFGRRGYEVAAANIWVTQSSLFAQKAMEAMHSAKDSAQPRKKKASAAEIIPLPYERADASRPGGGAARVAEFLSAGSGMMPEEAQGAMGGFAAQAPPVASFLGGEEQEEQTWGPAMVEQGITTAETVSETMGMMGQGVTDNLLQIPMSLGEAMAMAGESINAMVMNSMAMFGMLSGQMANLVMWGNLLGGQQLFGGMQQSTSSFSEMVGVLGNAMQNMAAGNMPALQAAIMMGVGAWGAYKAVVAAGNIAQAVSNVLNLVALIQTKGQAGATGAKTAAQAAETMATIASTAAQTGLNTAMSANPIMAVVTVISLLVGALASMSNGFNDASQNANRFALSANNMGRVVHHVNYILGISGDTLPGWKSTDTLMQGESNAAQNTPDRANTAFENIWDTKTNTMNPQYYWLLEDAVEENYNNTHGMKPWDDLTSDQQVEKKRLWVEEHTDEAQGIAEKYASTAGTTAAKREQFPEEGGMSLSQYKMGTLSKQEQQTLDEGGELPGFRKMQTSYFKGNELYDAMPTGYKKQYNAALDDKLAGYFSVPYSLPEDGSGELPGQYQQRLDEMRQMYLYKTGMGTDEQRQGALALFEKYGFSERDVPVQLLESAMSGFDSLLNKTEEIADNTKPREIDISKESIEYLRDSMERRYVNEMNVRAPAPTVTVSFNGDIRETADVDAILETAAYRTAEQMSGSTDFYQCY